MSGNIGEIDIAGSELRLITGTQPHPGGFFFSRGMMLNYLMSPLVTGKEGFTVEDIWLQVSNIGFPMALAIYLLVRVEKKLDDLTVAISTLGETLRREFG